MNPTSSDSSYRGRIAPTPTGYLHLGHYATFRMAWRRAREAGGTLVFRDEDIDPQRCRAEFSAAAIKDLRWAGLDWDEGPDTGGPFAPYGQSQRAAGFRDALEKLSRSGHVYACTCSRKDVMESASAPHDGDSEPIYPGTCRDRGTEPPSKPHCWRFRVPDGEPIEFLDQRLGPQRFEAGRDFGDFIVWRRDDAPAYELAVVVDDASMNISEVVRGEDLLLSTARQLLLYRALGLNSPNWYHCPLVLDADGRRLAKRHASMALRELREAGKTPDDLRCLLNCGGAE